MRFLKTIFLLLLPLLSFAQPITNPDVSLKLRVQSDGGRNGMSVAYSPEKKIYYATIGGNAYFPLESFSEAGRNLHTSEAGSDMRSLWWNSATESLEGNCYSDGGIIKLGLGSNGFHQTENTILFKGMRQPDANCSAAYDYNRKKIIYYFDGKLYETPRSKPKAPKKGRTINLPVSVDNINATTVIYTGETGYEIGLLDYVKNRVYLFDVNTLNKTATIQLPEDISFNDRFNFSYTNNHLWFFDVETRVWTGYKIF